MTSAGTESPVPEDRKADGQIPSRRRPFGTQRGPRRCTRALEKAHFFRAHAFDRPATVAFV